MVKATNRVIGCKCHLPLELHERFLTKIMGEGWSIQEALFLLIRNYTDGNFDIKEEE